MIHRYYIFDKVISDQNCDAFLDRYKKRDFENGAPWSYDDKEQASCPDGTWVQGESKKKAKVHWVDIKESMVLAIWACVLEANRHYELNLTGFGSAKLTKYSKNDFYGWHQDSFYYTQRKQSERKLSAILQLSMPEDYEGCELQLFNGDNELEELPIKNQGSIIVFRSEDWHRVTELTKGTRYSLVFWAVGPPLG